MISRACSVVYPIDRRLSAVKMYTSWASDKARYVPFAVASRRKGCAAAGAGRNNKSSQLRKFYDELVMWHDKLAFEKTADARAAKYRELAPFIKMMNAKAAYAKGRGHVDQNFEKLFSHLISQIACPATLKNAKLFMEAVLGFLKAEEK